MKRSKFIVLLILIGMVLYGCAPARHPDMQERFVDDQGSQLWEESSYDLVFYYSPEYKNFEHSNSRLIGRFNADEEEYLFEVHWDSWGGLYFELAQQFHELSGVLFAGQYIDSGDDFSEVKVFSTKIPEVLPEETILHFDISAIEEEELYIPDFLGKN